jgi:DNA-binding transcriptional LysR family regulator
MNLYLFGMIIFMEAPRHLEPRRLRYFLAVAEELNFSRAAERLHMAQPPLSKQIKQLEGELGVQLFDRPGRGVQLTEAGQLLLQQAQRILMQIEQTESLIQRVGRGEVGHISIGFVPSASNDILPPILRDFRNRFPEVELFLHEMRPDQLVDRLRNKWVDVGFLYLPLEDDAFHCKTVSREPLVVALPSKHPLSSQPTVKMQALTNEPFILPPRYRMPGLYGQVTELCRQAGFTPRAVQKEVWLMQTIVGLVAGEIGVALVPASLRNLHRKGVVYKEVQDLMPTVEMGVIWRRDDDTPVLSSFLKVVDEVCRQ